MRLSTPQAACSACQQVTTRNMHIVPLSLDKPVIHVWAPYVAGHLWAARGRSCCTKTHRAGHSPDRVTQKRGSVGHLPRTSGRFHLKLTLTKLRFVCRFLLSAGEVQSDGSVEHQQQLRLELMRVMELKVLKYLEQLRLLLWLGSWAQRHVTSKMFAIVDLTFMAHQNVCRLSSPQIAPRVITVA